MNIEIIGTKIGELRREKAMTQEEMAKRLGISAQAVSKWENGGAPDIEMLPQIADLFGVSTDYLFGRVEKKEKYNEKKLTVEDIIEKITDLQARMSDESNSMVSLRDSIAEIGDMGWDDDEAKGSAIENVADAYSDMRLGFNMLVKLYEKMYNDLI